MTTIVKIGIGVAAAVAVVAIFPAIKGPYNRLKNEVNEKLDAEYVVDNYKAEYVALHEKRGRVAETLNKCLIEKKVVEKKLDNANDKIEVAKKTLKEIGTSDLKAFARAKDVYEALIVETNSFEKMVKKYDKEITMLKSSLACIDLNMAKAKRNVDILSSKKVLVDTIKTVNKSIENINGIGDSALAVNVEKLDDDMLRESIKLEALNTGNSPKAEAVTQESAKAYLDAIK